MKIVVLDGRALNPGDLSWAPLERLGECAIYARTPREDILERAAGARVVLTNKTPLGRGAFAALPELSYVGVLATGYDVVDVAEAARRGITVTNVPAYGTASVAQATFALLLHLTNHVAEHGAAARAGRWSASGEFSLVERPMTELSGLCLGIVGLGQIGRAVARIGLAFGMEVLAASGRRPAPADLPVRLLSVDELFAEADVVTLHCPLTPQTARMVDAARLARMKRSAILVNTARGGLVDEAALVSALGAGVIAGAALDVLSHEPPAPDHPLLHCENCLVTPHNAWATRASRARLLDCAIANVEAFVAGRPVNVVARPTRDAG